MNVAVFRISWSTQNSALSHRTRRFESDVRDIQGGAILLTCSIALSLLERREGTESDDVVPFTSEILTDVRDADVQ